MEKRLQRAHGLETGGQFAGGLAHDFNNLLGVILGYCDSLEGQPELSAASRQMAAQIQRAGVSARNLTQRLLAFCRQRPAQPTVLDLNAAVQQMQAMLRGVIGPGIEIRSVLRRGLATIHADPTEIEQVLMNLFLNARDAMPEGGRIFVETANLQIDTAQQEQLPFLRRGDYVRLVVGDSGNGIDPAIQGQLFEPFCSTKPAGKGTGLGLSTVLAIVKECGGAIDVSTTPGRGSVFTVYFPRCVSAVATQAGGGKKTILLVDDATDLRQLTRRMLMDGGYEVLDAGEPAQALREAREHTGPLPLMITDLFLPGFSGSVLAEKLALFRPETKVLYTSGFLDEGIVPSGVRGLDYDFLQKPFTRDDLLDQVRALLEIPQMPVRRAIVSMPVGTSVNF